MHFLNLFIINLILVFIIDLSGFIPSLESGLSRLFGFKVRIPRPFSCALCMTFWTGMVYILFTGWSWTSLLFVCALALFSKNTAGFIRWIQEALVSLENLLYKLIR